MKHEPIRRFVIACRFGAAMLGGLSMTMTTTVFAQSPSPAVAVNNWADLRATLASCWSVPPDTRGSLIAFLFGISKTGELRGAPLVTRAPPPGRSGRQKTVRGGSEGCREPLFSHDGDAVLRSHPGRKPHPPALRQYAADGGLPDQQQHHDLRTTLIAPHRGGDGVLQIRRCFMSRNGSEQATAISACKKGRLAATPSFPHTVSAQ